MRHTGKHKETDQTIEGTITTTAKGIGFVDHESYEEDIRIEAGLLSHAMDGDLVRVLVTDSRATPPLGKVLAVVKRAHTRFVGTTFRTEDGSTRVIPDDRRAYFSFDLSETSSLDPDLKVLVELSSWADGAEHPTATLIETIGKKGDHEAEIRSIILENGIDDSFPATVTEEARRINETRRTATPEEISARTDFRNIPTFTIDPVDAKDFDDALSVRLLPDGTTEVGIHIADVSHYVQPGSSLDREALSRAFSVYLVDRTIPMLPEVLSNDICSLRPNEDRLTFSVWCTLDENGNVLSRNFGKTIIHSIRRFTYEEAQSILDSGSGEHFEELSRLQDLSEKMRTRRMQRGAIDFEQHEVRFELADDGVPLSAYLKERLATHKLIEEFMLLANHEVAKVIHDRFGKNKRHSFIYRIHDLPDRERIKDLSDFVKAAGYTLHTLPNGDVTGKALNQLFDEVSESPEEDLIKTAALRSMAKARYAATNIGHFGLALREYTHFTSPIRRYADLLVHRLLEIYLSTNDVPSNEWTQYDRMANQISDRELVVIGAERDSVKYKQVEYMSSHVGETFTGIVTGVSEWGIFVAETGTKAEGLVSLRTMKDDFYTLEQKKYRLVGKRTRKVYSLGDRVRVKVLAANVDRKTIDYELVV